MSDATPAQAPPATGTVEPEPELLWPDTQAAAWFARADELAAKDGDQARHLFTHVVHEDAPYAFTTAAVTRFIELTTHYALAWRNQPSGKHEIIFTYAGPEGFPNAAAPPDPFFPLVYSRAYVDQLQNELKELKKKEA